MLRGAGITLLARMFPERIMRANEEYLKYESLNSLLEELQLSSAELHTGRVRPALLNIVAGYESSNSIDDFV